MMIYWSAQGGTQLVWEETVITSPCSWRESSQSWGPTTRRTPPIGTSCTVWTETAFDVRAADSHGRRLTLMFISHLVTMKLLCSLCAARRRWSLPLHPELHAATDGQQRTGRPVTFSVLSFPPGGVSYVGLPLFSPSGSGNPESVQGVCGNSAAVFGVQLGPDSDQLPAQPASAREGRSRLSGAVSLFVDNFCLEFYKKIETTVMSVQQVRVIIN